MLSAPQRRQGGSARRSVIGSQVKKSSPFGRQLDAADQEAVVGAPTASDLRHTIGPSSICSIAELGPRGRLALSVRERSPEHKRGKHQRCKQGPHRQPMVGARRRPGGAAAVASFARCPSAAIELRGLRREFGERAALSGIDLELDAGRTLAVLGRNGSGKTTLLRVLAGLLRPSGGEAAVLGCALPAETWRLRGRVGFLGHSPLALPRPDPAREPAPGGAAARARARRARAGSSELLAAVGMAARADDRVAELSAGMAQRDRRLLAVLHEPELLLLDEPDSHLDAEARELVGSLTGPAAGRTRVLVSHDRERALARSRRGAGAGMRDAHARDAYLALLGKDLRVELRTLRSLPAMALFAVTTFVIFRFGLDRTELEGGLGRRSAGGDPAVRGHARDQPPVRGRARGGWLRADPPGPARPHGAVRRQVVGAVHLSVRAGAGRGPDLRALLPRLGGGAGAAGACAAAGERGARRHGHADLDDRDHVERPRPAGAADPAAAAGAAGDRRRQRCRAGAARGWPRIRQVRHLAGACSASTIWCSRWSATRSSTSCSRTRPPARTMETR